MKRYYATLLSGLLWLGLAAVVLFAVITELDTWAIAVVALAWMGGVVTHMLLLKALEARRDRAR